MSPAHVVDQIANAVLYEGYLLYPYRPSAIKNQVRWTFGGVLPRDYCESERGTDGWVTQTECIVTGDAGCRVDVEVRFLQLVMRRPLDGGGLAWQEARERRVSLGEAAVQGLADCELTIPIRFAEAREADGAFARSAAAIDAAACVGGERVTEDAVRLRVRIENLTPVEAGMRRDAALMHALVSCHVVMRVTGGSFASQTDPPADLMAHVTACENIGLWPVLVGDPTTADTMLASPIILEDHPRIAEESAGDLFDSTEIDELLSLRILSLTDAEKAEVRAGDERGRLVLERTEALTANDLMRMHGTIRGLRPAEDAP